MGSPINRAPLTAAQTNLVNGEVSDAPVLEAVVENVYDYVDVLNSEINAHTAATTLPHADGSVTTSKIRDGAVTEPKLATGAVSTNKLADNSIITSKIQNNQITEGKMGSGAVSSRVIANQAVQAQHIDPAIFAPYPDSAVWVKFAQVDEHFEEITKPYNYLSIFTRITPEPDDTGRFQRAINDSISKGVTLIVNEPIFISGQINITNQIAIDGVSWRTGLITLTTSDACIMITDNGVNSFVYEVTLRNLFITGSNAANYCIRLENASQIKIHDVYADKALVANIEIVNSSILYFDGVYSYYSPKAFHLQGVNNINIFHANFWDIDVVFNIKNAVTDLVITDSWHEKYNQLVKIDNSVVTTLYMYSKGSHYLDSDSPNHVFVRSTETTNDKSIVIIIEQARINLPTMTSSSLFQVSTSASNSLIKFDISNSYLFLPAAVTSVVNTAGVNSRTHMHISYQKNRSKDVAIASDYNKAIILGPVTMFNGEQVFYSTFVLPQNPSIADAAAAVGTMKFDGSHPAVKDPSGSFKLIPYKGTGYQADSTATDVTTLKNDFNNLLSILRSGKIID